MYGFKTKTTVITKIYKKYEKKHYIIKGSKVVNYVSEHRKCYVANKRYFEASNIKASALQRMSFIEVHQVQSRCQHRALFCSPQKKHVNWCQIWRQNQRYNFKEHNPWNKIAEDSRST